MNKKKFITLTLGHTLKYPDSRNTITERETLITVDLLIRVDCFVTEVNNIFNIKIS